MGLHMKKQAQMIATLSTSRAWRGYEVMIVRTCMMVSKLNCVPFHSVNSPLCVPVMQRLPSGVQANELTDVRICSVMPSCVLPYGLLTHMSSELCTSDATVYSAGWSYIGWFLQCSILELVKAR